MSLKGSPGLNLAVVVTACCLPGCQKLGEEIGRKVAHRIEQAMDFDDSHVNKLPDVDEEDTAGAKGSKRVAENVRSTRNLGKGRHGPTRLEKRNPGPAGPPAVYVDENGKIVRVPSADQVPTRFRNTMIVMGARLPAKDRKDDTKKKLDPDKGAKGTLEQELDKVIAIWKEPGSKSEEQDSRGKGTKNVTIYQTAWCPACKAARMYMDRKGIDYVIKDVERNPTARREFKRYGGRGVPLLVVGDQVIRGFDPNALERALR